MPGRLPRRSPKRLSTQILLLQVLVLAATLALGLALAVLDARSRLDEEFEQRALAVARSVAATPEVAAEVVAGRRGGALQERAERVRRASGATFVVVTDRRGIRFTHPTRANIGRRVSTDPSGALDGRTVLAVETGTLGRSARAKVPLRDAGGAVVGEVSVGILETRMRERLADVVPGLALYSGAALLVGALASLLLAARLKRRTFGLELDAIAGLLREREAMLHGIREGVVAVDPRGRVSLVNDEARKLLDLPEDAVGRTATEALGPGRVADLLDGREAGGDVLLVHGEHVLVANATRVARDGRELGRIVTLRDRTELEALLRELDSVRGLTDAMRAQAHEFSNRLHTLSGLLALERHAEARSFIREVAHADGALRASLSERIGDPRVAALLLAKSVVATERGARLALDERTLLDGPLPDGREALTVLGNLVDNALDATAQGRGEAEVRVLVRVLGADLELAVADTGPGVAPEDREDIWTPGWSSKGEGRGVGLALVAQLAARRGGSARVDEAPGGGARFRVVLPGAAAVPEEVAR